MGVLSEVLSAGDGSQIIQIQDEFRSHHDTSFQRVDVDFIDDLGIPPDPEMIHHHNTAFYANPIGSIMNMIPNKLPVIPRPLRLWMGLKGVSQWQQSAFQKWVWNLYQQTKAHDQDLDHQAAEQVHRQFHPRNPPEEFVNATLQWLDEIDDRLRKGVLSMHYLDSQMKVAMEKSEQSFVDATDAKSNCYCQSSAVAASNGASGPMDGPPVESLADVVQRNKNMEAKMEIYAKDKERLEQDIANYTQQIAKYRATGQANDKEELKETIAKLQKQYDEEKTIERNSIEGKDDADSGGSAAKLAADKTNLQVGHLQGMKDIDFKLA